MSPWIIPARAGFTRAGVSRFLGRRDHPRACGVYARVAACWAWASGSSPRVRGLRQKPSSRSAYSGIIPARAGFTRYRFSGASQLPDHPRACGVYDYGQPALSDDAGSSPRVRGLRRRPPGPDGGGGIIPARAGFTRRIPKNQPKTADHPRACGVYCSGVRPALRRRRIIPARAGFTGLGVFGVSEVGDHPRACGVYPRETVGPPWPHGSSPRVRGLRPSAVPATARPGIIPARAGFTRGQPVVVSEETDHPRACGVYGLPKFGGGVLGGSSPRVRGLRVGQARPLAQARIIPARAGFTRPFPGAFPARLDHPRACGVYLDSFFGFLKSFGSSPRVRGLRVCSRGAAVGCRIIPARAGFTLPVAAGGFFIWDHPRACGVYVTVSGGTRGRQGSSPRVRGLPHRD